MDRIDKAIDYVINHRILKDFTYIQWSKIYNEITNAITDNQTAFHCSASCKMFHKFLTNRFKKGFSLNELLWIIRDVKGFVYCNTNK